MYAITGNGYRAITQGMDLMPGETLVSELPSALLVTIEVDEARIRRDQYLRETDWTQMPDAPLSVSKKSDIALYRQLLRDLPSQLGFPNVQWPQMPSLGGAAGDIKAPI
jgi:hypothetical protein